MLFKIGDNSKVTQLRSKKAGKEKGIQELFENNLSDIMDVTFLESEYSTGDGRIDTLGIDANNSPVIIEYKKEQNPYIIIQAFSYMKWLLDHKAEFENLVQKNIDSPPPHDRIEWDSARIICVAGKYNKYDLDAVELMNRKFKIDLLKFEIHEENILLIERLNQEKFKKTTSQDKGDKEESREEYSLVRHLEEKGSEETKKLYYLLKEKILDLDRGIEENVTKKYISFRLEKSFTSVFIQKNTIKIYLNIKKGELDNAEKVRDVSDVGHYGVNEDSEVIINSEEDLEEHFHLIEQTYYYNK